MKTLRIQKTRVSFLKAPLIQPFRTALGQHDSLDNILFTIELDGGKKGFGEAAIATHITGETREETIKNLTLAGNFLQGRDIADYLRISAALHERFPGNQAAIAAIETAIFDVFAQALQVPLWKLFGNTSRRLSTDITIVIADLAETEYAVKNFYRSGFRRFKVKIGRDQDLDFKRVEAVSRVGKNSEIYLDANQGYSAKETLRFLALLKRKHIIPVLIEQPVPKEDWEGLKRVTRLSGITVCADESVRTLKDCLRAIREKAVNAINIKLMKSGFVHAREIAVTARAAGMDLMIGGMMESSLAMTAAAHLACGLGCFRYIDLDTPFFIKKGIEKNPYLSSRGIYDLRGGAAGIGITPL